MVRLTIDSDKITLSAPGQTGSKAALGLIIRHPTRLHFASGGELSVTDGEDDITSMTG
jgi:hypothetical protein